LESEKVRSLREQNVAPVKHASPWLFFVLAFILSWLFWVPAAVISQSETSFILLHFAYNFTFSFVYPVPESVHLYGTVLVLLMVIVIVIIWGPQTLAHRKVLSLE